MRIKLIASSALALFVLAVTSTGGYAAPTPGSHCEAPNENQAPNLGWSQSGTVNNSTTDSFFVVCGVNVTLFPIADVFIDAIFPGSGDMNCIYRAVDYNDGSFMSAAVTVTSGVDGTGLGAPDANHGTSSVFASTGAAPPVGLSTGQINVVCPLGPGEGIADIEAVEADLFDLFAPVP